jgi:deoxyribodipyrimidine photolyase-like uncharacterized protein
MVLRANIMICRAYMRQFNENLKSRCLSVETLDASTTTLFMLKVMSGWLTISSNSSA